MNEINPGDVVQLKSGSQDMTAGDRPDADNIESVVCYWWDADRKTVQTATVHRSALKVVRKATPPTS